MTTATQARPIQADGLRAHELEELRECIHNVQKGLVQYEVLLTNRKQTKSKKRLPGEHYDAHPALAPTPTRAGSWPPPRTGRGSSTSTSTTRPGLRRGATGSAIRG